MLRGPRLDAPGVLPHVRARGMERQQIFQADADREDFVQRLARVAAAGALTVYAWALLPNHFHLLVRTGRQPLARSMRSLLTGYAGASNRRSRRSGQVWQNRYKSVVCDAAVYFLALVRSLPLNPLRARIVADLEGLDNYAYSGPAAARAFRNTSGNDLRDDWRGRQEAAYWKQLCADVKSEFHCNGPEIRRTF